jgi:hypothetical protein
MSFETVLPRALTFSLTLDIYQSIHVHRLISYWGLD